MWHCFLADGGPVRSRFVYPGVGRAVHFHNWSGRGPLRRFPCVAQSLKTFIRHLTKCVLFVSISTRVCVNCKVGHRWGAPLSLYWLEEYLASWHVKAVPPTIINFSKPNDGALTIRSTWKDFKMKILFRSVSSKTVPNISDSSQSVRGYKTNVTLFSFVQCKMSFTTLGWTRWWHT